jgi:hypothetical protein
VHNAIADDPGLEWALVNSLSHQTAAQQAGQWDPLSLFGPTPSFPLLPNSEATTADRCGVAGNASSFTYILTNREESEAPMQANQNSSGDGQARAMYKKGAYFLHLLPLFDYQLGVLAHYQQ